MANNPYAADLGSLDPLTALGENPDRIRAIVTGWTDAQFERSYSPGKWSARKLLVHLAQTEMALGARARYALSTTDYAAQSFEQDDWIEADNGADARTALDAYTSLRKMNLAMWRGLSESQRTRTFTHPEFGELSVIWVAAQMAGHDIHHLKQFEQIART